MASGRAREGLAARAADRQREGVDLHALTGSGPGGRIVKADVLSATPAETQPRRRGSRAWRPPRAESTEIELSRTQQTIARRMAESKATIPDFTLAMDVDMEECVKLRAQLKQHRQPRRCRPTTTWS